jgi:superfamily II DNA/RNA helicase
MSFLPSSIFGRITRQSVFHPTWLNTKHVRLTSRTAEAYAEPPAKEETKPPLPSFESLGLGVPFIQALQRAYPQVKTPTDIQTQLIPAVLGTQDIFLKDVTGSGKCVILLSLSFFVFSTASG